MVEVYASNEQEITTKTKETKTAISKKYFFKGHAVYSK